MHRIGRTPHYKSLQDARCTRWDALATDAHGHVRTHAVHQDFFFLKKIEMPKW